MNEVAAVKSAHFLAWFYGLRQNGQMLRQTRAAAALGHPNVATVYELGGAMD